VGGAVYLDSIPLMEPPKNEEYEELERKSDKELPPAGALKMHT
jgi:hypothetical protein